MGRSDPQRLNFVKLADLVDFTNLDWSYTRSIGGDWIRPAIEASRAVLPDSYSFQNLPAGGDIPTIVALQQTPHWYRLDGPFDSAALKAAFLDLKIVSTRLQGDAQGRAFF